MNKEDCEQLAAANVVTTILPGTSLYTGIKYTQVEELRKAGCCIAIASDHNPGSCNLYNLPFLISLACLNSGVKSYEALPFACLNAAKALRLEHRKGALSKSYDADFFIHPSKDLDSWLAEMGHRKADSVWIKGAQVY